MYDQIRDILNKHLNASIELQEAIITWHTTHPDELIRAEERLKESIAEVQGEGERE